MAGRPSKAALLGSADSFHSPQLPPFGAPVQFLRSSVSLLHEATFLYGPPGSLLLGNFACESIPYSIIREYISISSFFKK